MNQRLARIAAPKQNTNSLSGLSSFFENSSTIISEHAMYMNVPPATLRISAPTISGAEFIPSPTATPVDSVKANPS